MSQTVDAVEEALLVRPLMIGNSEGTDAPLTQMLDIVEAVLVQPSVLGNSVMCNSKGNDAPLSQTLGAVHLWLEMQKEAMGLCQKWWTQWRQ